MNCCSFSDRQDKHLSDTGLGGTIQINPFHTPDMLQLCHLNDSFRRRPFYNTATVKNKHVGIASHAPKESLYPHVLAHLSNKFIRRKWKKKTAAT